MSLSTKILILLAGAAIAFLGGWKTRDAFCDAAAAKKQVVELKLQIAARDVAAAVDAQNAVKAAQEKEELEGVIRDLESQIGAGECLDTRDADSLRKLWR